MQRAEWQSPGTGRRAEQGARLTEATLEALARDASAGVRAESAYLPGMPPHLILSLAADPEPRVRRAAVSVAWDLLDDDARDRILLDPDAAVRKTTLLRRHRDVPMSTEVLATLDGGASAAGDCALAPDAFALLSTHQDRTVRRHLALNPGLTPDQVAVLAADPDEDVRRAVSVRPELTEEQRAAIHVDVDGGTHSNELAWVVALHEDDDAMRRLAASTNPLVRRSVARARHLPSEVVARLARDPDRAVRLFLAESCDDAPPEMLLEVWDWWEGSLSHPDRPLGHPNFPREGMARYADDPDPRMRQLAVRDPQLTSELWERLSRDPEPRVRAAVAADPRLPEAQRSRLFEDPDQGVGNALAANPALPSGPLVELLLRPGTARSAAANPALPADVMHRMLDAAEALREAEAAAEAARH